jgi:hypothetical protein
MGRQLGLLWQRLIPLGEKVRVHGHHVEGNTSDEANHNQQVPISILVPADWLTIHAFLAELVPLSSALNTNS